MFENIVINSVNFFDKDIEFDLQEIIKELRRTFPQIAQAIDDNGITNATISWETIDEDLQGFVKAREGLNLVLSVDDENGEVILLFGYDLLANVDWDDGYPDALENYPDDGLWPDEISE